MATREELSAALDDYLIRVNASERVQRTMHNWNCIIHLESTDTDAAFTMIIENGSVAQIRNGLFEIPDLIVSGSSENLANIFWGDENPASNYMQGIIKVQGSSEDVMRLDAITMFIFLGQ